MPNNSLSRHARRSTTRGALRAAFQIAAAALALGAAPWATAHGDVDCAPAPIPKAEWRPHTELEKKLTQEGWAVRRMVATKTCYEVYAKTPDGQRVEAFFHPKTFERVMPR